MGNETLISDARFMTNTDRLEHEKELKIEIDKWTGQYTSSEIVERLEAYKVPAAPVLTTGEIMADPQLRHRNFFAKLMHPVAGAVEFADNPVRLSKTPAQLKTPSPTLGQHTKEVLQSWMTLDEKCVRGICPSRSFW